MARRSPLPFFVPSPSFPLPDPAAMLSRASLRYLLPLAVLFTTVFGAYYIGWGLVALRRGNVPFALFYGLYGFGGVVLGLALWRVWRQSRRPAA